MACSALLTGSSAVHAAIAGPFGTHVSRPLRSLFHLFCPFLPCTNPVPSALDDSTTVPTCILDSPQKFYIPRSLARKFSGGSLFFAAT